VGVYTAFLTLLWILSDGELQVFCEKWKRKVTRKMIYLMRGAADAAGECGVLMLKGYGANGERFPGSSG
jgi:hypothetical protein